MTRTTANITCPLCGYQAEERMLTDACQVVYLCRGCRKALRPQPGDCCVFCSYADTPCPPIQKRSRVDVARGHLRIIPRLNSH